MCKTGHELEDFFQSMKNNILKKMQDMELDGGGDHPLPLIKQPPPEVFTASPVFNYGMWFIESSDICLFFKNDDCD